MCVCEGRGGGGGGRTGTWFGKLRENLFTAGGDIWYVGGGS